MIDYPKMMNAILEHVEEHLEERLSVEDLAQRSGYSPFHFARMFRACVGISVKQYVLGRKLDAARRRLGSGERRVIEVACELGFESPEVFSRAFRRAYGVAPSQIGDLADPTQASKRPEVTDRDIANWRGILLPHAEIEDWDELTLAGLHCQVDVEQPSWSQDLQAQASHFLSSNPSDCGFDPLALFIVVRCLGVPDRSLFDIFHGRRPIRPLPADMPWQRLTISPGCWGAFSYRGDLLTIRETVEDDAYRWMAARGLSPPANAELGMLFELAADYEQTHKVRLRIPLAPA